MILSSLLYRDDVQNRLLILNLSSVAVQQEVAMPMAMAPPAPSIQSLYAVTKHPIFAPWHTQRVATGECIPYLRQ
jgi:hypothetical protein